MGAVSVGLRRGRETSWTCWAAVQVMRAQRVAEVTSDWSKRTMRH